MRPCWKRQLGKAVDIVFKIPCGMVDCWNCTNFEPLIVGVLFPFISVWPWQLRGSEMFLELGGKLRRMWKACSKDVGPFLRELCLLSKSLCGMQKSLVRKLLQAQELGGVPGDQAKG